MGVWRVKSGRGAVPARNDFDFCHAMAGNLLILAHFGKEFVHFG